VTQWSAVRVIWFAGSIHAGIVCANVPLPRQLRVCEGMAHVPRFLRQIFYVHWLYIVLIVGAFSALCFGFAEDLAGASAVGRFLSGFLSGFWLLRIVLQCFYYDREVRRAHRVLDSVYVLSILCLTGIFTWFSVYPVR
jgi:UDP-N-acetylmuramyl pentapeptide phosphotransferase/UDP-N-acetylglucosamine-1-phosphate transferase